MAEDNSQESGYEKRISTLEAISKADMGERLATLEAAKPHDTRERLLDLESTLKTKSEMSTRRIAMVGTGIAILSALALIANTIVRAVL